MTGSIQMPYGSGTFDAIVCPGTDPAKLRALPGSAPTTPFGGTVGGASFTVKSELALVERRKDTGLTIAQLQLHATAGVPCKAKDAAPGAVLYVIDIGGPSSIAKGTGSPQPALASMTQPVMSYSTANVWVQLDKLAFETGGKVTGRAVVDAADAKLAGAFTATVCGP